MKKYVLFFILPFCIIQLSAQVVWQQMANFGGTARNHSIGFSHGTKGYVVTGLHGQTDYKDFWEYNSLTNTWTQLPDYPGQSSSYGVGFVINDKAYIGLGDHRSNGVKTYLKTWWEYNFLNSTWTQKSNFPGPGRDHPTSYGINGKIYMGFGDDNSGNYRDWWEYNPATDTWTQKTSYPGMAMHHPVSAAYNNKIYIGGGHVSSSSVNYSSQAWYAYNTLNDTWTQLADMPGQVGKVAGAAFVLGNQLFTGIGIEEPVENFYNDFYQYNIATNTWTTIASYPGTGTFAPVSFAIGNDGYVVTGMNESGADTKNCYRLHYTNTAGIEGNNNSAQLNAYPNPVQNTLMIENEKTGVAVELYSSTGSLVNSYMKNENILKVDMSNLAAGMYFVKIEGLVSKVVKE